MPSQSKCRRQRLRLENSTDGVRGRTHNPSTYGLFAYFLFTAPANPIQFATFERRRRSAMRRRPELRVVIEKNKRSAFFLRNLLRFWSGSRQSRPDRASVLSRVDRRGLWGRRASAEEPEYQPLTAVMAFLTSFLPLRRLSLSGLRGHVIRQ